MVIFLPNFIEKIVTNPTYGGCISINTKAIPI